MKLLANSPIIAYFKNINFVKVGKPDFREGRVEKLGQNQKNRQFLTDSRENRSNFFLGMIESTFLHVLDPNTP